MGINVTKPTQGTGTRFVLASQIPGINLDSNVETGGGTDDTAALLTVLNTASASNPLMLVMDGAALVGQLVIKSHTTVQCLSSSCGFYFKNNGGSSIFRNANPSRTARTDTDIAFVGGTYNGNGLNQPHHDTVSGTWTVGIGIYGITNLILNGVKIKGAKTFSSQVANFANVRLLDCEAYSNTGQVNTDGPHFNGPGEVAYVQNLRCFGLGDDSLAFNCEDLEPGADIPGVSGPNALGPWVGEGNIRDVTVDGLYLDNCQYGFRGLARNSRFDRLTVRHVHGTLSGGSTAHHAVILNHHVWPQGGGTFGAVTLEDIDVVGNVPLNAGIDEAIIKIQQNIETLTVRGFKRNNFLGNTPSLQLSPAYTIGVLDLSGFIVSDKQATEPAATEHLRIQGTVGTLVGSGWEWSRKAGFVAKTPKDLLALVGTGNVTTYRGDVFPAPTTPIRVTLTAAVPDSYITLESDMTFNTRLERGSGTVSYARAVSATPGTFSAVALPGGLTGDVLKVSVTGLTTGQVNSVTLVPTAGYTLPNTSIASDNFNRADGAVANGWTAGGGTNFQVLSNQLVNTGGAGAAYKGPSVSSGELSGSISPYTGLAFGLTDLANYFLIFRQIPAGNSRVLILRVVNGNASQVADMALDAATGPTPYSVRFNGTAVVVKQGATEIYNSTIPSLTAGFCGVNISSTTAPMDNWNLTA